MLRVFFSLLCVATLIDAFVRPEAYSLSSVAFVSLGMVLCVASLVYGLLDAAARNAAREEGLMLWESTEREVLRQNYQALATRNRDLENALREGNRLLRYNVPAALDVPAEPWTEPEASDRAGMPTTEFIEILDKILGGAISGTEART